MILVSESIDLRKESVEPFEAFDTIQDFNVWAEEYIIEFNNSIRAEEDISQIKYNNSFGSLARAISENFCYEIMFINKNTRLY